MENTLIFDAVLRASSAVVVKNGHIHDHGRLDIRYFCLILNLMPKIKYYLLIFYSVTRATTQTFRK